MAWYAIDISYVNFTNGVYHRLCREFQKAFIRAGAPPELALFASRMGPPDVRRVYLSPLSSTYVPELLQAFKAQSCPVPCSDDVTLVYGVPEAHSLLEQQEEAEAAPSTDVRKGRMVIYPMRHQRRAAATR